MNATSAVVALMSGRFTVVPDVDGETLAWFDGPSLDQVWELLEEAGWNLDGDPYSSTCWAQRTSGSDTVWFKRQVTPEGAVLGLLRLSDDGLVRRRAVRLPYELPLDPRDSPPVTETERIAVTVVVDHLNTAHGRTIHTFTEIGEAIAALGGINGLLEAGRLVLR
jgi:hypothetical protein